MRLYRLEYENVVFRYDYESSLFEIYTYPINWGQFNELEIQKVQRIVDRYMNTVIALNLSVYRLYEL